MAINYKLPRYVLHEIGDIEILSESQNWGLVNLDIPSIWKKTKGEGVRIAVIDTGITRHPDLVNNVNFKLSRSCVPGEDAIDVGVFHGVHVAGIIAAENNSQGVVGVAPKAEIVSIKALNKFGMSFQNSIKDSLKYCLDEVNPDIINMSLGGTGYDEGIHDLVKQLTKRGIPVVCAAGNRGTTDKKITFPASLDESFCIGSYSANITKDISEFTSIGEEMDFCAPGDQILSTYGPNRYAIMSGTSMAAPMVSGIIALLIAKNRQEKKVMSVEEIKKKLIEFCADLGDRGWDVRYGYGVINAKNLILSETVNGKVIIEKDSFWKKLFRFFS